MQTSSLSRIIAQLASLALMLTPLACGMDASDESPEASQDVAERSEGLSAALRARIAAEAGLTPTQAEGLVRLYRNDPTSYTNIEAYVTPGLPAANAPMTVVTRHRSAYNGANAKLRYSDDAWATFQDETVAGSPFVLAEDGRPALISRFDIGPLTGAQRLIYSGFDSIWYGSSTNHFRIKNHPPAPLQWLGDVWISVSDLQLPPSGSVIHGGHDVEVHVQTYPQAPNHQVTLHYTTDNFATTHVIPMALDVLDAGNFKNNAQWVGVLPTSTLATGTPVRYWIQATDGQNNLYASQNGANYQLSTSAAPAVGWMQKGTWSFNKCGGGTCSAGWFWYGGGINGDFRRSNYQVYASAPSIGVQVYVPGLTDVYKNGQAASMIRAEIVSPFFNGSPNAAWKEFRMYLRDVSGNDYRYCWDVRDFRATPMPAVGVAPNPPAGTYPFKFRVSTDGGKTWVWLGTDPWPNPGQDMTFTWDP